MRYLILLLFILCSCKEVPDMTPDELNIAASRQQTATEQIDNQATSIVTKSKEAASVAAAKAILNANDQLKKNTNIIKDEAAEKEVLLEENAQLRKKVESVKKGQFGIIVAILFGFGVLALAAGAWLAIKSFALHWYAPIPGVLIMVSCVVAQWIYSHPIWFVIGLFILGAIGVGVKVFMTYDKATQEATKYGQGIKNQLRLYAKRLRQSNPNISEELFNIIKNSNQFANDNQSSVAKKMIKSIKNKFF